jgi:hypothetical protein
MNKYTDLKSKQQAEVDAFPFGFAFNQSQFNEMMEKWGFTPDDTDKIYSIGGGGYIRKSDSEAMHKMFERHALERKMARKHGDDYLFEMFNYELANHEYSYTQDLTDTLEALGLTMDEINADPRMADALKRAIAAQEEG